MATTNMPRYILNAAVTRITQTLHDANGGQACQYGFQPWTSPEYWFASANEAAIATITKLDGDDGDKNEANASSIRSEKRKRADGLVHPSLIAPHKRDTQAHPQSQGFVVDGLKC